jgi:hypothetical protein
MINIITKRQIETRQPEQKKNGSTNVDCTSVRTNIAKPDVSGWRFLRLVVDSCQFGLATP